MPGKPSRFVSTVPAGRRQRQVLIGLTHGAGGGRSTARAFDRDLGSTSVFLSTFAHPSAPEASNKITQMLNDLAVEAC
jgi:hypothetical protein